MLFRSDFNGNEQGSVFRLQNMEGLTLVGLFMEGTTLTCLETYSDTKKRTLAMRMDNASSGLQSNLTSIGGQVGKGWCSCYDLPNTMNYSSLQTLSSNFHKNLHNVDKPEAGTVPSIHMGQPLSGIQCVQL
jgi:hypothetical protein